MIEGVLPSNRKSLSVATFDLRMLPPAPSAASQRVVEPLSAIDCAIAGACSGRNGLGRKSVQLIALVAGARKTVRQR